MFDHDELQGFEMISGIDRLKRRYIVDQRYLMVPMISIVYGLRFSARESKTVCILLELNAYAET